MIAVVDAAFVVDLVCGFWPGTGKMADALSTFETLAAPAHLDAEALSALARLDRAGQLTRAGERVRHVATFPAERWALAPLLPLAWGLTTRMATRDALYVALAQRLGATLLTTDRRLANGAEGIVPILAST